MTLNWSGKYTGCLLIIGRVVFPGVACTGTDAPTDRVWTGGIQLQDGEAHVGAANTHNNCHVTRMMDNSKLMCAGFRSRTSAVNNAR